jgi:hypothetical protein
MLIYTGANTIFNHQYKKELHDLLSKDEANIKNTKYPTFDKKINSSGIPDILEIINFCLTIILIIFYILSTYTYPETSHIKKKNKFNNGTYRIIYSHLFNSAFFIKIIYESTKNYFFIRIFDLN